METNFKVKIGEIDPLTFIRRLGTLNGFQYLSFDFKAFNGNHYSTFLYIV